jgi:hypothetical protein
LCDSKLQLDKDAAASRHASSQAAAYATEAAKLARLANVRFRVSSVSRYEILEDPDKDPGYCCIADACFLDDARCFDDARCSCRCSCGDSAGSVD